MATRDDHPPSFTTSEEDQRKAAELSARLRDKKGSSSSGTTTQRLTSVKIDEGAHKYVLINASLDGEEQVFVTSKRGAAYHQNAAEPFVAQLEEAGYYDIEIKGGGRIFLNEDEAKISIFGHSYGFGKADHTISQKAVLADPRYKTFQVTISDEGY
jgi:phosphohistidine phosphatase